MKNLLKIVIALVFGIAINACSTQQPASLYESIMLTSNKSFRGIEIGMTFDDVKSKEKTNPDYEEKDAELYYHYDLNETDSFTISYSFDEKGLYEIHCVAFINNIDEDKPKTLFYDLKNNFIDNYGQPSEENNSFTSWQAQNKFSNEFEISIQETSDSEKSEISISYYDYDY